MSKKVFISFAMLERAEKFLVKVRNTVIGVDL